MPSTSVSINEYDISPLEYELFTKNKPPTQEGKHTLGSDNEEKSKAIKWTCKKAFSQ